MSGCYDVTMLAYLPPCGLNAALPYPNVSGTLSHCTAWWKHTIRVLPLYVVPQTYLHQPRPLGADRQLSHTQLPLLGAVAYAELHPRLQRVAVQPTHCVGGKDAARVLGVGKAAVHAAEVHHEAELPERANRAEQGDQTVLVDLPGELADEHLTAAARDRPLPFYTLSGFIKIWGQCRKGGAVRTKQTDIPFLAFFKISNLIVLGPYSQRILGLKVGHKWQI